MIPEEILNRVDRLKSEKANLESYAIDLANFCLPSHNTTLKAPDRHSIVRLFDTTALLSLDTLASGFSSHLTNPSTKWFSLGTKNIRLMEKNSIRRWFSDVEDEMYATLDSSNFEEIMGQFYKASGCFGTGCILTEEDWKDKVRFTSIPFFEFLFEEDSRGRVIRVYRQFEYTIQQAWDRWGMKAGEVVAKAIEGGKKEDRTKRVEIVHAVFPRVKRDVGMIDNVNMPYASVWIEKSKKHLISEGGFTELPFQIGRFDKLTGEQWGYSPAMKALSDIKMLNTEKMTLIRAAQKIVDPPFIVPHRGFIQPMNFNPSGANYVKDGKPSDAYHAIETKGNIPTGFEMIEDVKRDIRAHFFVPVFQAFAELTKQMTVIEVQRRIQENMVLLGPVVGRFTQEVFDPLITRVFMILAKQGAFPEPPPEIIDQELDIVYISQLAKAQRMTEISTIQEFLTDVAGIAQFLPNVIDKIDGDEVVNIMSNIRRIRPSILREETMVEEIRAQRAQAEELQAQLATAGNLANVVKTGAEANKNLEGVKQ